MTLPEKSIKNFSIRINSEGLCFICLRDTKVNGGDHAPPTSFRLRNISRFLGIDTKKILKAYLDYDLKRCSDVKVELCEGCSEQVQKFNCLYQTLELTKLKLDACVRKISSLIKEAEEECDDDRTGEMERRVTHATTKGVIVDLRAGISAKCLGCLESVPPRVILKRLPASELAKSTRRDIEATGLRTTTPIKIKVSAVDANESSGSFDNASPQMSVSDSDTDLVIGQKEDHTQIKARLKALRKSAQLDGKPTAAKQILEIDHQQTKLPVSQLPDGTLQASCPHCSAVFSDKQPSNLKRLAETHLTAFHVHTFFPEEDLKEPSLSSYQFQRVIHHHLFANISTDPENMNLLKCPNCNETSKKMGILRQHVIRIHYASLIHRLQELQKDSMIFKNLSKISKEYFCECGVYCPKAYLYTMHRSQFCRLIEKTPPTNAEMPPALLKQNSEIVSKQIDSSISKSADGTVQTPCPHCRAVVKTTFAQNLKSVLAEHVARYHLHTFFPEDKHKDPSLSSLQFKQVIHHFLFENIVSDPDPKSQKIIFKCSYCNATCTKSLRIKMHEIKCHYNSLSQRLEELQKDALALVFEKLGKIRKAFSCECGDYFTCVKLFKLHRKKICKLKGDHVEARASRETDSSTCKTERGPMESSKCKEMFEAVADADDHFSDSEDLCSIDIGEVKPCFSLGTDVVEEEIGRSERKRRGSESDSDLSSPETICVPRKVRKLE